VINSQIKDVRMACEKEMEQLQRSLESVEDMMNELNRKLTEISST
jgi:chromosome segregation ATPase